MSAKARDELVAEAARAKVLLEQTVAVCERRTAERDRAQQETAAMAGAMAGILINHAEPSSLAERAVAVWGEEAQMAQATEECAELIVAINHKLRGRIDWLAFADEVADVEFMLEQMVSILAPETMTDARERKRAKAKATIEAAERKRGGPS